MRELTVGKGEPVRAHTASPLWKRLKKNRYLYLMIVPGLLYFLVFKYLPMFGLAIAFQDYNPFQGVMHSPWVGFHNFQKLFADPWFLKIFRNTLILFVLDIVIYFPIPILLALMLNEVGKMAFKRVIQTIVYIPHFMSWVIIVSISYVMLTQDDGIINELLKASGVPQINFLMSAAWFRPIYIIQTIWQGAGWGTIVYLAAITSVDPQLYEAARMDGASRFRQIWHVTLPSIRSVIVVLMLLRLGHMLELGFEHAYLMLNAMNRNVGEIFDTYIYTAGLKEGQFSYSTAVGAFKSIIGLVMVVGSNWLAKKFGEEGVF